MKSLQTIQKTFKVFKTLSKIGMIVSFVWAGLTVIGLLCGTAWYSGGTLIGPSQEALLSLTLTSGLNQMMGVLLTDMVFALADGTLLLFAFRYLKQEQADGTPFTQSGAEQIKRLGIRTIVLPLVAAILSAVFYEVFDLSQAAMVDWGNLASLSMGIVLILASLVFRYGAELEEIKEKG
ncbi:hypothetical protein [Dysosmobacter sp.]|uniref:hypothetical protein n=1 Tax=Dysosmobacter sp. TaxID=2591382 RepID=UPI002A8E4546|nr:hypothetical protein [Dysosmobacter sp.]MDY3984064.1 hypothetical protein [Dysosmobacter sp.]